MRSIRVDIAPSILDWIGDAASFEGVDDKLRSHFYRWKASEEQPTYAQIETLSSKTHIPLGYFFLKNPPQENLPMLEFRTVNSASAKNPSRNLLDTYYQMSAIQGWMRDYLIDNGNEKLDFVGSGKNEKNPVKIAASVRSITGMSEDWYAQPKDKNTAFNFLRSSFEKIGIFILQNGIAGQNTHRPLNIDEFRAFTLIDDYSPLIFINTKDTEGGKLFSLIHEVVHIWLGLHSLFNDNSGLAFHISPLETLCNAAAAELLVPNNHFVAKWNAQPDRFIDRKVSTIASYFRCGDITVARRALDNNYINQTQYKDIVAKIIAKYKKHSNKDSGGDYYKTAKSRYGIPFVLALDSSIKEGKTTYTEAFRLTNTTRKTFDELVKNVRGDML